MGCGGSKPPVVVEQPQEDPPPAPERVFELKDGGVRAANGWYVRDGEAYGHPKYKHESNAVWVRRSSNGRKWLVVPRDGATACTCIYKTSVVNRAPTMPPAGSEWSLGSNWGSSEAARDGWKDGFKKASKHSRWPCPNSATSLAEWKRLLDATDATVTLEGAGAAEVNGTYVRAGTANGAPMFKHETNDFWIRHNRKHQGWIVTPKEGHSAHIAIYVASVSRRRPHMPPTRGWKLGRNWSESRAAKDGWREGYWRMSAREPPPGAPRESRRSSVAAEAEPIVYGELVSTSTAAAVEAVAVEAVCVDAVAVESPRSQQPTLVQMAELIRRELGLSRDEPLASAMRLACVELGVDDDELSVLAQAKECYTLLLAGAEAEV